MSARRCSDNDEKAMAIVYLCRGSLETAKQYLRNTWDMGLDSVHGPVMHRLRDRHDPLVEFYIKSNKKNRFANALHFYLAFNRMPVENRELVTRSDFEVYSHLEKALYQPIMERVAKITSIQSYQDVTDPLESMFEDVKRPNPAQIIAPVFSWAASVAYGTEKLDQAGFSSLLEHEVRRRIKLGCLSISGLKAEIVNEHLSRLPAREQHVLKSIYGLEDRARTFTEIAKELDINRIRLGQLRDKALHNLNRSIGGLVFYITTLSTKEEINTYMNQEKEKREKAEWYDRLWPEIRIRILDQLGIKPKDRHLVPKHAQSLDVLHDKNVLDLSLSVGTRNYLRQHNIQTLRDLYFGLGELRDSGIGKTSYTEIKKALENLGISAEGKEKEQPPVDETEAPLNEEVSTLGLSTRAENCLSDAHVFILADLVRKTESDLLDIRAFGRTCLRDVKRKLADRGLSLSDRT